MATETKQDTYGKQKLRVIDTEFSSLIKHIESLGSDPGWKGGNISVMMPVIVRKTTEELRRVQQNFRKFGWVEEAIH